MSVLEAAPLPDVPPLAVAPVLVAGSSFFADSSFFVSLAAGAVDEAPPLAEELDEPGLAAEGVDGAPPLAAELDAPGLAGGVVVDAPPEAELLGAPEGDDEGLLGEVAVLELEEPGVDEVLFLSPLSHAARPKASATAAAKMESFMCPPRLGYKYASKERARYNSLFGQGVIRARGTLCAGRSSYYLLGVELGLDEPAGFFAAPPGWLGLVDPEPVVPLAPDGLELPEAADPPPDAALFASRSQPEIRAPLRANTAAAANAVNFITHLHGVVCPDESK